MLHGHTTLVPDSLRTKVAKDGLPLPLNEWSPWLLERNPW